MNNFECFYVDHNVFRVPITKPNNVANYAVNSAGDCKIGFAAQPVKTIEADSFKHAIEVVRVRLNISFLCSKKLKTF